jgi:hypothetical protein
VKVARNMAEKLVSGAWLQGECQGWEPDPLVGSIVFPMPTHPHPHPRQDGILNSAGNSRTTLAQAAENLLKTCSLPLTLSSGDQGMRQRQLQLHLRFCYSFAEGAGYCCQDHQPREMSMWKYESIQSCSILLKVGARVGLIAARVFSAV